MPVFTQRLVLELRAHYETPNLHIAFLCDLRLCNARSSQHRGSERCSPMRVAEATLPRPVLTCCTTSSVDSGTATDVLYRSRAVFADECRFRDPTTDVKCAGSLRACYAVSGTDLAYGPTRGLNKYVTAVKSLWGMCQPLLVDPKRAVRNLAFGFRNWKPET
eukprot:3623193-Rhodomonas_salina.1